MATKTETNNASRNKKEINAIAIRSHHVAIEGFAGGAVNSFGERGAWCPIQESASKGQPFTYTCAHLQRLIQPRF
jgi:hypothetical protein